MSPKPKDPGMVSFSDDQVEPAAVTPAPEPPPAPEPEPEGPIDPSDPSEPDTDMEAPGFDIEAFVRSLPDGVGLCPLCLGIGAMVAEPPFDPHAHVCVTCLGYGKVRTGSLVGGQGERDCKACGGHGWLPDDADAPAAVPAMAAHFDLERPPLDHKGRTPDDPDFDWAKVVVSPVPTEHETATEPVAEPV